MRATTTTRLVCACALLSASCFDIEEKITLKKNLSGSAAIRMQVDMNSMVHMMAAMKKGMGGQPGEPTPAELEAIKKEIEGEQKSKISKAEMRKARRDIQAQMPKGLKVTKVDAKFDDMVLTYDIGVQFAHVRQLAEVTLEDNKRKGSMPGASNPVAKPFEHLKVVEDGDTIVIESLPVNPTLGQQQPPPGTGGANPMESMMKESLEKMQVSFTVTAPFKVIESNATRTRGKTLSWEYGYVELAKLGTSGGGMRVKYKK